MQLNYNRKQSLGSSLVKTIIKLLLIIIFFIIAIFLIEKIKGVDLLYHETTFMHDLKERAENTGHSTTLQAAKIARKAKVGKLLVGHYSQRYKDLHDFLNEIKTVFFDSHLTYSGMLVDLQNK